MPCYTLCMDFGNWNVLRGGYDLLVTLLSERVLQYLMSGKSASQGVRSGSYTFEEEAWSLTILQLNKTVRCTKGFDVSFRRGECLVHGVFFSSARKHSRPGLREWHQEYVIQTDQATRRGRLRGQVSTLPAEPREHHCCLTCLCPGSR